MQFCKLALILIFNLLIMKRLLLLAIPLLLFSFTLPGEPTKKEEVKKPEAVTACVTACMGGTMKLSVSGGPAGPYYVHVDGVLVAGLKVPTTGSVVTVSTLVGGNYAIFGMWSIPVLAAECGGTLPSCGHPG